jgi:hypothetical protein
MQVTPLCLEWGLSVFFLTEREELRRCPGEEGIEVDYVGRLGRCCGPSSDARATPFSLGLIVFI